LHAGDQRPDVGTLRRGGAIRAFIHKVNVRDLDALAWNALAAGDLHCDLGRRGSPDSLEADIADLNKGRNLNKLNNIKIRADCAISFRFLTDLRIASKTSI